MTDIVERLRTGSTDGTALRWSVTPVHIEAADEIERLRAECQRLAGEVSRAHRDALAWMERAAAARVERDEAQRLVNQARGERDEAIAALIERVEKATAEQQGEVIADAAKAISLYFRVSRMIEVEAYESAAVSLVPEGHGWHIQNNPSVGACWAAVSSTRHALPWGCGMRRAATPALALCAAALRARMESER